MNAQSVGGQAQELLLRSRLELFEHDEMEGLRIHDAMKPRHGAIDFGVGKTSTSPIPVRSETRGIDGPASILGVDPGDNPGDHRHEPGTR
jgi:hypothetical protein